MLLDTMCHIAENVGGRKNCWIDGAIAKVFTLRFTEYSISVFIWKPFTKVFSPK